jgi:radical SAM protein with 4Fe4S-binding SPASM domain
MVDYALHKGLKPIQIATNAFFLNPDITKRLLGLGIDFISFSVDVNNPEIYKKIRKNLDFKKVFSNIMYFLEIKRKKGLGLPEIQVSAVKTDKNAPFIQEFIDFWKNKVDRVRIYYAHSLKNYLGEIQNNKAHKKRKPCLKLLTDMVIYWNGDVAICNHDWQRDIFIGNTDKESIKEIWNNPIYKDIRKKHLNNDLGNISPCNYCSHWQTYYQEKHLIGELYEKNKIPAH